MNAHWLSGLFRRGAVASGAAWFARLKSAPVTARLDKKYRRWLAAHPANEIDYERNELAWALAGELAKDDEIAALLEQAEECPAPSKSGQEPRRAGFSWSRPAVLAWSAAAATLAAVAIGVALYSSGGDNLQYATAVGEQRTVVLPDQSRMMMNTSTSVRVSYRRKVRSIELERGEVTFSVTHDSARPFEVTAAQGVTRALGTEFNVLSANGAATVAVLSGKVEVITRDANGGNAAVKLLAGQEVSYTPEHLSSARPTNADRIQAWHTGRIAFADAPLSTALAEFNRYTRTPVVVRDASLDGLRVTGLFRIGETDALLNALHSAFGIRAERRDDVIELYRAE